MSITKERFAPSFDLTLAAQIHYRGVVRVPRWAGVGFLVLFCALVIWRLLAFGFELLIIPLIAGIPVLAWIVAIYAAPGPIAHRDAGSSVEIVYRRGQVRRLAFEGPRLRFRLLERAIGRDPSRINRTLKDSDHLLLIGYERIALSPEAYVFLDQKATAAGYGAIPLGSSAVQRGGWHVREYARKRPA